MAKRKKIAKVFVHLFTDGRDSKQRSAKEHLEKWKNEAKQSAVYEIATIGGRFYGMDRAKNWDRLKKAYDAIVENKGKRAESAEEAIDTAYAKGLTDEFVPPTVICKNDKPIARVSDKDAVIFFNLRSDRARQLTKLFVLKKPKGMEVRLPEPRIKDLFFVTLTGFGPNINVHTAFKTKNVNGTIPYVFRDLKQLYISEIEKFAHVTFFLNGGFSGSIADEDQIMIPSPQVKSYAEVPEMSAKLITDVIMKYIKEDAYDFIFVNFPNPDMLGHTGDLKAAIKGIEFVDKCLGNIWKEIDKKRGGMFIMADHGNADEMLDKKTGETLTFHTKNPVPFVVANNDLRGKKLASGGKLGNVAPTILEVMGLEREDYMDEALL